MWVLRIEVAFLFLYQISFGEDLGQCAEWFIISFVVEEDNIRHISCVFWGLVFEYGVLPVLG